MAAEKDSSRLSSTASALAVRWKQYVAQVDLRKLLAAVDTRPVIPYALALLVAVAAKLPTLNNSIIFIDEPAYLNEAARLDTPFKFVYSAQYVSETKLPLGLLPYLLAQGLNHDHALRLLHLFGLLAVAACAVLLLAISRRACGTYLPGLLAAAMWCAVLTKDEGTMAPLLEYVQAPLVLGALWVFVGWVLAYSARPLVDRRSLLSLLGAGALVGAAGLVKPPGILMAPVLALGAFLSVADGSSLRGRLYVALLPLAGAAAAVGVFVLPYLVRPDALGMLRFNLLQLTAGYSGSQGDFVGRFFALVAQADEADLILVLLALVTHCAIYAYTRRRGRRSRENRIESSILLVLLATGLALGAGYMTGQAKASYVVAILPPLLLYGWGILALAIRPIPSNWAVLYVAAWVLLLVPGLPSTYLAHYQQLYTPRWTTGQQYAALLPGVDAPTLAGAIAARTRPGDAIWVYYNAPEIYWLADRRPATDEPVGTWLVDFYDQFWFERTLQQLQAERPTLIVGFDSPRYQRTHAANLLDLPLIGAYIQSHYTCSRAAAAEVGGPAGVELCTLGPSQEP